jgi:hypothetical protein
MCHAVSFRNSIYHIVILYNTVSSGSVLQVTRHRKKSTGQKLIVVSGCHLPGPRAKQVLPLPKAIFARSIIVDAPPLKANLLDTCVALKFSSSEYQLYA